jgi:hypothetical protein
VSNTLRTLNQRNTPFTWFILILSFVLFFPSVLVERIWIDVRDIHVVDSVSPDSVEMHVDRTVLRKFNGMFSVTVRRADGEYICTGAPKEPFEYKPGKDLPSPLYLEWWIGGAHQMDACIDSGFGAGRYFLDTCHIIHATVWDIPFARRCVQSNEFTIENDVM